MYIRIQTNRAKLREVLASFQRSALKGERLIAPRPLPKKTFFKSYIGFARVTEGSQNQQLLSTIKNHKQIEKTVFESEVNAIDYFWEATNKSV